MNDNDLIDAAYRAGIRHAMDGLRGFVRMRGADLSPISAEALLDAIDRLEIGARADQPPPGRPASPSTTTRGQHR